MNTYAPNPTEPLKTVGKKMWSFFAKRSKEIRETIERASMTLLRIMFLDFPCGEHESMSTTRLTIRSTTVSSSATSETA